MKTVWLTRFSCGMLLWPSIDAHSALRRKHEKPAACVSLLVYEDRHCTGNPIRSLTFPTWTKPGSDCYHDATMPGYSVKDQYCDMKTGNWHETVYLGSEECSVYWYEKIFSPQELMFTTEKCTDGLMLDYCVKGSCPSSLDGMIGYPNPLEHPVALL